VWFESLQSAEQHTLLRKERKEPGPWSDGEASRAWASLAAAAVVAGGGRGPVRSTDDWRRRHRHSPGLLAMASWRAMKLRDTCDTPSRHGVLHPWSPAGKNEGWRDYADYAPELREYNEQKKATRSQGARARSRSSSRRAGSRSPSPSGGLSPITPVVVSRASSRADDSMASSWRLSYRASISRRTKNQLKQQRPKRVGQLPVFSGISTFTLRNMGITHLQGMGVHPEVTKVFVQQNFLTSFEGWEHQPQLVELHASDNYIESFKSVPASLLLPDLKSPAHGILTCAVAVRACVSIRGMTSSTTIERLFLVGNPITHCYHYRIMAIAACGRSLRMIDNEPVRKPELDRAIALGKVRCSCSRFLRLDRQER